MHLKEIWRTAAALVAVLLCSLGFTECYKPVTLSGLPPRIRTVAVPAFQNNALRYRIETQFTEAVINEVVRRGRGLRVVDERDGADLIIDGVIKDFTFTGVLLDERGRSRVFEVTVRAAVTVRDKAQNRVLYDNQNYVFRGEYEFTNDPQSFFNEEDPAVQRMARAFAESVVSTVVNGFGVNESKNE
ncbi:MAG: LptE family protein [Pyrinomonadaceae bacterium]